MYPELLRIGPVVLNSYGILFSIGVATGLLVSLRMALRRGIKREAMLDLAIVVIVSAILGARLLYVLFNLSEFAGRWQYAMLPLRADGSIGLSGLIFLGGFLLAVPAGLLVAYQKGISLWQAADSVAPGLALGIFWGRIGCFLNGCCFGKACDYPWGVHYPAGSPVNRIAGDIALHPTQLYEAMYGLVIFFVLIWLEKRQPFKGQPAGVFLVLYGISRIAVDFLRYYESHMFIFAGIEFNQIVSFIMLASGIIVLIVQNPSSSGSVGQ